MYSEMVGLDQISFFSISSLIVKQIHSWEISTGNGYVNLYDDFKTFTGIRSRLGLVGTKCVSQGYTFSAITFNLHAAKLQDADYEFSKAAEKHSASNKMKVMIPAEMRQMGQSLL
jgi:hypothetical protein